MTRRTSTDDRSEGIDPQRAPAADEELTAEEAAQRRSVGLCIGCRHVRRIVSAKGSTFHRCERARTDERLRDYPPLPVLACHGFEPR